MTTHAFPIIHNEQGHHWECRCGATGNSHATDQQATRFGIQHLQIEAAK